MVFPIFKEFRVRRAFHRWSEGWKLEDLDRLRPLVERDLAARCVLGASLAEQGDTAEALQVLAEALPAHRATALIWDGRPDQVPDLLSPPSGPLEESLLGLAALERGDRQETRLRWRSSSPMHWRLVAPRAFAGILAVNHQEDQEGLQQRLADDLGEEPLRPPPLPVALFRLCLDGLEKIGPTLTGNRERLEEITIRSLRGRGRLDQAIRRATAARKEHKESAWATGLLVELLIQAGNDQRLLDLDPKGEGMAGSKGVALARLGRWDQVGPMIGGQPDSLLPLYAAACAAAITGKTTESARHLLGVLALDTVAFHEVATRELEIFSALGSDQHKSF